MTQELDMLPTRVRALERAVQSRGPSALVVRYQLVEPGAKPPYRAHEGDAGLDLCVTQGRWLLPGETAKLSTGVAVELPPQHQGDMRPRSSTTLRGLAIAGTVDASYRGVVHVLVANISCEAVEVKIGDRIAQMIVTAIPRVQLVEADELSSSARGVKAFGSSGGAL